MHPGEGTCPHLENMAASMISTHNGVLTQARSGSALIEFHGNMIHAC